MVKQSTPQSPEIQRRPQKLSYHYEKNDDSLSLRDRKTWGGEAGSGGFMAIWLSFWTFGCVMIVGQVIKEPTFFSICFALPFLAFWFFGAAVLLASLFGKITVRLDRDGLFDEHRVLLYVRAKQVPLAEIRYFHATETKGDESVSYAVEAVTDGKPVEFSARDFEEAKWLAHEMNQVLAGLKDETLAETVADDVEEEVEEDEAIIVPMNSRPQRLQPPSDCRWSAQADYDSVTFQRRGKFSLLTLAVATFIMLFWNGIVSVFVMLLWGFTPDSPEMLTGEWWFLFVFLIPFEIAGLAIFVAWLGTLTAPFHLVRWRISRNTAESRTQWFGIGRTRRYSLENCREMAIAAHAAGPKSWAPQGEAAGNRKLAFVDYQNREMCVIPDLTPGEARWMADNVLGYR